MRSIINILLYLPALLVFFNLSSCEKAEGPDKNYYIQPPSSLMVELDNTTADITWEYPKDVQSLEGFLVEASFKEDFGSIERSVEVDPEIRSAVMEDLGYFAQCYFRVRALSKDIVLHSDFVTAALTPDNLFKELAKEETGVTSVTLRWDAPASGTVDHILLIPASTDFGTTRTIQLGSGDISSYSKLIDGLVSAGTYTAVLFGGEDRKGVITFTTVDINASITINGGQTIYQTLMDAIEAASSGDVINVGVAKYDFSAASSNDIIGKSITIKGNGTSENMPEITMPGFTLSGNVASLKISGVKFIVSSGNYFIETSASTGPCNIEAKDVDITGPGAGLVYASSGATAANVTFSIENSLLHNFGASGGDFIDFRAGILSGITVKNCTIWDVARDFFRVDATTSVEGSILFQNCTIDEACHSPNGRFLYIRAANTIMTIENCILTNKVASKANGVSGSGTNVTFNNNNVFGNASNEWGRYVQVTNGTTTLDPEYTNRTAGDFTVGNAAVKGANQGDPRWL